MSDKIYPAFSKFDQNEVELFRQSFPQYDTPENLEVLQEFCSLHCVPCNLYNLTIGMHDAVADGRLEKSNHEMLAALDQFREECVEWENFASQKNGDAIERWLQERHLEVTVENLHKAFTACVKSRRILPTPAAQGIKSTKNAIFIRDAVAPEDRKKYADDVYASDSDRKRQDAELRRAALADRYSRRKS